MLTYLISTINDLASTAVLVGLAVAYARAVWPQAGVRTVGIATVAGLVASVVMAVFKHATNMIDTGTWNMVIFIVAAVAGVVFLLCMIGPVAATRPGRVVQTAALSLFVFLRVFYKVPDVYLYPFGFSLSDDNILSSDFFTRLAGYLAGITAAVLIAVSLVKLTKSLSQRPIGVTLAGTVGIIGVVQVMTCVQTLLARRMIANNHTLFQVVKWFSNNSSTLIFVILALAVVLAVLVIAASLRDDQPYRNPAEHRKILARWRNRRRWSICLLALVALSVVTLTVIKDYDSRGPELSPPEECEVRDGAVYVSLDQVADGHLHRFTYTTEAGMQLDEKTTTQGGIGVRFIIIKKPNSNAYGIGLDACEICGESGYYERDGQVVCKLCDVVMNINTIGFKGGCNPIPVEYSIADGSIILPTEVLAAYEKTFK